MARLRVPRAVLLPFFLCLVKWTSPQCVIGPPLNSTNLHCEVSPITQDYTRGGVNFTQVTTLELASAIDIDTFIFSTNPSNYSEQVFSISPKFLPQLSNLILSHSRYQFVDVTQSQLAHLDVSNNCIENITHVSFRLDQLQSLNLSSNSLVNITNLISTSLKVLDLSNNSLESLFLRDCTDLRVLNLSGNGISEVKNQYLQGLDKLEVLDLSRNNLQVLIKNTFREMVNLLRLDINSNKLEKLEGGCFTGLIRLQYLDVSKNRLTTLSPSTMQDLPALTQLIVSHNVGLNKDIGLVLATRTLHKIEAAGTGLSRIPSSLTRSIRILSLTHNSITSIECGDLDSYPLLSTLDLGFNNLSRIEDDALGRLELLTNLDLSHNYLSSIPRTLPGNLTTLLLSNNLMSHISQADFTGLTNLQYLDISNNNIVNITDSIFSPLKSLESLNVSGNPIQIMAIGGLAGLNHLRVLDLSYLNKVLPCNQTLCFPVPEANRLQEVTLRNSPQLSNRLLQDAAALRALKQLNSLDMASSNVTSVREDLMYFLPHLSNINLDNNTLNCTSLQWMHNWLGKTEIANCISTVQLLPEENTTPITTTTEKEETTNLLTEQTTNRSVWTTSSEKTTSTSQEETTTPPQPTEYEILTNEIWDNTSASGAMFAFASETRTSHPGLFILLLLPVALVSAVLVLNYGRRPIPPPPTSIEISDFTSDLW